MTDQLPRGEKRILLMNVSALPCWDYRPAYYKVYYWATKGCTVRGKRHFLEAKNEGGRIHTTVEAVQRFLKATNGVR